MSAPRIDTFTDDFNQGRWNESSKTATAQKPIIAGVHHNENIHSYNNVVKNFIIALLKSNNPTLFRVIMKQLVGKK